ncbi:unnamed protein product [Cylindrotheca closterium]|uniref:Cysteine protease n=1 Tax=Cylindrotheca closterium TaxID=2856 RepID=A0AAD2CTP1_9STRA|nr:unnamed protein product [Cylindrotheca closterium]
MKRAILLWTLFDFVSKADGLVTMIPGDSITTIMTSSSPAKHSIPIILSMTPGTTSPTIEEEKTALDYFDDMQDDRIDRADQIPIDLSVFEDHLIDVEKLPPIVELEYLQDLYASSESANPAMRYLQEERLRFFQKVQLRGGCCLVKFDSNSQYTSTLRGMWSCMEAFYRKLDAATNETNVGTGTSAGDTNNDSSDEPLLMRQHLVRPDQSSDAGGYDFVQTYLDSETKSVMPTTIQDSLGCNHPAASAVEDSFHALSDLSKMFAIILASGGLQRPIHEMKSLLNGYILDDFGCCNHRLCQYRPLDGTNTTSNDHATKESSSPLLRSHTDWSLVTCIPVSPTPGLLIFDPLHQKWLAPDAVVNDALLAHEDEGQNHSQYCLMMTGKAMDMLLGIDGGMACIHQVVPRVHQHQSLLEQQQAPKQRRISAPFFLRPKESVSVQINEQCNRKTCTSEEVALAMLHGVYCKLGA